MKAVYHNSSIAEKEAKSRYFFPENIMMENAAAALEKQIEDYVAAFTNCDSCDSSIGTKCDSAAPSKINVLILSGSGNNGADGIALARRIYGKFNPSVILFGEPKTLEAQTQLKMALAVGVPVAKYSENGDENYADLIQSSAIIVDCIFGTGFHGDLPSNIKSVLEKVNKCCAYKIACDIPSGLFFNADVTVTMGALKSILFTDKAKEVVGKIKVADLGISSSIFEQCASPDAFLIEKTDVKLPFRTKKSSHKGTYGHTVVISGQKSGAAIIASQAALNFGSGLTTIVKTENSNLEQFKISPELMISTSIPKNATAILIGPGLGSPCKELLEQIKNFPAVVLDADILTFSEFKPFLDELCDSDVQKIILTPHPKELACIYNALGFEKISAVQAAENRFEIAEKILQKYPKLTLVLKSANTLIAENNFYIVDAGTQALAKGGSGDVLAGMTASLLAQGYSAKDAAITAVYAHAIASKNFCDGTGWDLSPQSLIEQIKLN